MEPENQRSVRSTRISLSRAWPATFSSSATAPIASCASSVELCASRTPAARRQPSRSGSAKRRRAATNFRSRCRACVARSAPGCAPAATQAAIAEWLAAALGVGEAAASQAAEYLTASHAALGCLPTQDAIVLERFFDEAGGMQLVVHSPYGGRVNRAWGLALRKRFCRKFNFELQAAATEDNIVLSLTSAHSFELAEVARYLHSSSVRRGSDPGACSTRRCSPRAGAGRRESPWRSRGCGAAGRFRRNLRAWRRRI